MDYYDSQKHMAEMKERRELPPDARFMLQAEGRGIEKSYLAMGRNPRRADVFSNYFGPWLGGTDHHTYEWTLTGLRVPPGWEGGRRDSGTGEFPRIVLEGDEEVGEIQVPAGDGMVVVGYDDVFGVPVGTARIDRPHRGLYTRFHFNTDPGLDDVSGKHDVGIIRRGYGGRYLCVDASKPRSYASRIIGFRPVRGDVPEIGAVSWPVEPVEHIA